MGLLLRRARSRERHGQDGFTIIEFAVATGVMLVAIVSLLATSLAGLRGIASARRRQTGTGLANQAVEQVRGLRFTDLQQGLSTTDLQATTDTAIDKSGGPTVYRYGAEQIVMSTSGGPAPLGANHQQQVVKNNLTFTVSSYLTYYQNSLTSKAFRYTVVVKWLPLQGGSGQVQVQTVLYSPTCGAAGPTGGSGLHPFSAPCQAFLYGSASSQAGQIGFTSGDALTPVDNAALWTPSQASGLQSEQIESVSGSVQSAGVSLKLKSDSSDCPDDASPPRCIGRNQANSSATNDPGQPNALQYQIATAPSQACNSSNNNCSASQGWGADQLTVGYSAGGTHSTMSTVNAATASRPCPLLSPTSSFDLTQNDGMPCGNSKGQQGSALTGALGVTVAGLTLNTTLASVSAPASPSGSFVNLDTAPEATACTQTSGDGCVESQQYRTLGSVVLLQLPVTSPLLSGLLPGYDATKGLVRLTSYSDSATAEAGVGSAAPAATVQPGAVIDYYTGTGYGQLTCSVSSCASFTTPTPIPFGLGGLGINVGSALGLQISITGNLSTGGTSVSDSNAGCTPPCTRTLTSATVKSPIVGSLALSMSYLGIPVTSVTTSIDLGTTTAQSSYKAAPSAS
jgi:hypothetical protein